MLLLHTNPSVNTAHFVNRKRREMSLLCGENSTVCLFPQIRQFCAPHSLAHRDSWPLRGGRKHFPLARCLPWPMWTEAKFIYSYFKNRLQIISRALTIFAFLRRHGMIPNHGWHKSLNLPHPYKLGKLTLLKHTLLPSRSLNKTTQKQCTFSPFPSV